MSNTNYSSLKKGKGQRKPLPQDFSEAYKDIVSGTNEKRLSLTEILENASVINALCDILIEDGVIKEKDDIQPYQRILNNQNLYGGLLAGLIMTLKEDDIVSEFDLKLECGVLASHATMMHFGTRTVSLEEVLAFRREVYLEYLSRRRKN